jgi:hypothetical protein
VGRLVAAGQAEGVAFEAGSRLERRELRLVAVDGALKIDDISTLEPHVDPDYAIRILTEIANSEPQAKAKALDLIAELRRVAGTAQVTQGRTAPRTCRVFSARISNVNSRPHRCARLARASPTASEIGEPLRPQVGTW